MDKPTELSLEQMEARVPILPSLQLELFYGLVRPETLNCPYVLLRPILFSGRQNFKSKFYCKYPMNLSGTSVVSCSIHICIPQKISISFSTPTACSLYFECDSLFHLTLFSLECSQVGTSFSEFQF